MKKIVQYFLLWRLWLFVPVILAVLFLPVRSEQLFTIWPIGTARDYIQAQHVYPWANFDGVHYLSIASRGYVDEGRFMPFFPALIYAGSEVLSFFNFNIEIFWVGIFVSTVSSFFAIFFLHKLFLLDFKKEQVNTSIILFLVFPTAFFLAAVYSEGLFLLLSVMTFYYARKRNWLLASVLIMFAAVTRLSGLLLLIPIVYEYFVLEVGSIKKIKFSQAFFKNHKQVFLFCITPLLLLGYAYLNFVTWGDFLYFVHAHAALGNSRETVGLVFPLVIIYRYLEILFTVSAQQYEYWIAVLEFISLWFISYGIYLVWKLKLRLSYLLYSIAMVLLPLFSGTLTGFPRYILPVFPVFIALSILLEKHTGIKFLVILVSALLQALLLALFVRRYFVA